MDISKINLQMWIVLLLCVLLVGCSSQQQTASAVTVEVNVPKTPTELQPTPKSDVLFQVIKPDNSTVGFTWDELQKMPLAQITVEGKIEEGIKVLDVLHTVGIGDIKQITLTGVNGSMTLSSTQVTDQVILDFTNHGTVKLAATNISKSDWIKDIYEIMVK